MPRVNDSEKSNDNAALYDEHSIFNNRLCVPYPFFLFLLSSPPLTPSLLFCPCHSFGACATEFYGRVKEEKDELPEAWHGLRGRNDYYKGIDLHDSSERGIDGDKLLVLILLTNEQRVTEYSEMVE